MFWQSDFLKRWILRFSTGRDMDFETFVRTGDDGVLTPTRSRAFLRYLDEKKALWAAGRASMGRGGGPTLGVRLGGATPWPRSAPFDLSGRGQCAIEPLG